MKLYPQERAEEMAQIMALGPVIPVISLTRPEHAEPLAQALYAGGMRVFEVTLRSPIALQAISTMRKCLPSDAVVGAGTVVITEQVRSVLDFDGQFIITPGMTPSMLDALIDSALPILPGASSAADLMLGMERGLSQFKLFPAQAVGGVALLKSFAGPFSHIRFCPTGGVSMENLKDYLSLANVDVVGGSWLSPSNLIEAEKWHDISEIAKQTIAKASAVMAERSEP